MTRQSALLWGLLALAGLAGVALGAYGGHGRFSAEAAGTWSTAVTYQLIHVLAGLAALLLDRPPGRLQLASAAAFLLGIVLFSGSLYLRVLGISPGLPMAPVGGILLMTGWLLLAVAGLRLMAGR